jgi:hypothetical protein
MEDEEFDLCNEELKKYLEKDNLGKIVNGELLQVLQIIFRQGYILGFQEAMKSRSKKHGIYGKKK